MQKYKIEVDVHKYRSLSKDIVLNRMKGMLRNDTYNIYFL